MCPGAFLSMNHNLMPEQAAALTTASVSGRSRDTVAIAKRTLPERWQIRRSLCPASAARFVNAATNYLPSRLTIERRGNGGYPMKSAGSCQSGFHLWTPPGTQVVSVGLARCRMLPSVRPLMQRVAAGPYGSSRTGTKTPTACSLARWKPLVLPAPSRRLLCHTLLRPTSRPDDL